MGEEGMRAPISKGPAAAAADAEVNHWDPKKEEFDRRKRMRKDLANYSRTYADILNLPSRLADYLEEYWFDPNWQAPESECWWKENQPIEPIMRYSLIKAIDLAEIHPPVPIDSYWVAVTGNTFEVLISRNDRQVTRLILTPRTPEPPSTREPIGMADLWVVKRGEPGYWEELIAKDGDSDAILTRLKRFY